jgi:hypothetical protein
MKFINDLQCRTLSFGEATIPTQGGIGWERSSGRVRPDEQRTER